MFFKLSSFTKKIDDFREMEPSMDKVLITNLLNMSVVILVEVELMHFGEMCRQCLGLAEDHSVTDWAGVRSGQ